MRVVAFRLKEADERERRLQWIRAADFFIRKEKVTCVSLREVASWVLVSNTPLSDDQVDALEKVLKIN